MKNFKNPSDAMVREDFPGGFDGDPKNKFMASGRTDAENEAFNFTSKLANFRKSSTALKNGKLMQYIPSKNVYVYARYDQHQTILCMVNADTVSAAVRFRDFSERTEGFDTGTNIMTNNIYPLAENLNIPGRTMYILELKKRSTGNKSVH